MHRPFTSWISGIALCASLLAIAACGSKAAATDPKNNPVSLVPTPGGLVKPTAANAYLIFPRSTVRMKNGDILVTDAGDYDRTGGKIVKFSPSGTPLWVYTGGLVFPHSAYPMRNGDIMVSDTGNDRVIEINKQGKIVWNTDDLGGGKGLLGKGKLSNGKSLLYPNDAYPLKNGDVLISARFLNAVYEVTPTGKVAWSCARFMFRQHNPRFLPNGNLIVADSDDGRGLIINHACSKIVFQYGWPQQHNVDWPRTFQPDGGDYIIGNSVGGTVYKISPQKKIVDEWRNLPTPFYVTVLKNGDLLTQDTGIHGVVKLLPNGVIQKVLSTTNPSANTYPKAVVNPGFEKTGPKGWLQGDLLTESLPAGQRADMSFDTSTAHSGKSSGKISWPTNTSHLSIFWYENMAVTPGHTYSFSGWIKTNKVLPCKGCDQGPGTTNPGDAYFWIQFNGPNSLTTSGTPGYQPGYQASGTYNWTPVQDQVPIPAGVHSIKVECVLTGWGTVWFDDVTLHDMGKS